MTSDIEVKVVSYMTKDQAMALAQLLKRITFSDIRSNAVDDVEAYTMIAATVRVREGLAEGGFNPR